MYITIFFPIHLMPSCTLWVFLCFWSCTGCQDLGLRWWLGLGQWGALAAHTAKPPSRIFVGLQAPVVNRPIPAQIPPVSVVEIFLPLSFILAHISLSPSSLIIGHFPGAKDFIVGTHGRLGTPSALKSLVLHWRGQISHDTEGDVLAGIR